MSDINYTELIDSNKFKVLETVQISTTIPNDSKIYYRNIPKKIVLRKM